MPSQTQQLNFAIRAVNEASATLKAVQGDIAGIGTQTEKTNQSFASASTAMVAKGVLLANAIAGIARAGVDAGRELATGFAEAGSQIHDLAQRTGFSTQALSEWKYAADQSGTSIEGLEVGIRKMEQAVSAANDGSKQQVETLAAIGLKVADLRGQRPEQIFDTITSHLASMTDETTQADLAVELFGRSGTQLLPILKDGAGNLAQMRAEASKLGIVFSQEDANAADKLGDDIKRLTSAFDGLKLKIGRELAPILGDLIEQVTTWITSEQGRQFAQQLSDGLKEAITTGRDLLGVLDKIGIPRVAKVTVEVVGDIAGWVNNQLSQSAFGTNLSVGDLIRFIVTLPFASNSDLDTVFGRGGGSNIDPNTGAPKGANFNFPNPSNIDPATGAPRGANFNFPSPSGLGGGLGAGGVHTTGGGSNPLADAWKKINEDLQAQMVQTWLHNGDEQRDIVMQQNAKMVAEVQATAERVQKTLGVDMATAVDLAYTFLKDQEQALIDARIKGAEVATKALQKQMEDEAKLAEVRQAAMQSLLAQFTKNIGGGAFGGAFGAVAAGNNVSDAQLQAAIEAGNAATNARDPGYALAAGAPSMDSGGWVPGPIGSAQVIVAHGGEYVTPAGGGGTTITISIATLDAQSAADAVLKTLQDLQRGGQLASGTVTG